MTTEDNNKKSEGLLDKAADALGDAVDAVKDAAEDAAEAVAEVANEVAGVAEDTAEDLVASAQDSEDDDAAEVSEPATKIPGEDPGVGGAAAHLVGISRPQDEYGPRITNRDDMSDAELEAMGVEPDEGPGATLMLTFVAMVVILIGVGVGLGSIFKVTAVNSVDAAADRVHPELAGVQAEGAELLGSYAVVEHEADENGDAPDNGYRVPIDVAMNVLVEDAALLGRHPMGERTDEERTAAAAAAASIAEAAGVSVPVAPVPAAPAGEGAPANPHSTIGVDPTGAAPAVDPHAGHNHDPHAGHNH